MKFEIANGEYTLTIFDDIAYISKGKESYIMDYGEMMITLWNSWGNDE